MSLRKSLSFYTLFMLTIFSVLVVFLFDRYITNAYDNYDIRAKYILIDQIRDDIQHNYENIQLLGNLAAFHSTIDREPDLEFLFMERPMYFNNVSLVYITDKDGNIIHFRIRNANNLDEIHIEGDIPEKLAYSWNIINTHKIISDTLGIENNYTRTGFVWSNITNRFYLVHIAPINMINGEPSGYVFTGKRMVSEKVVANPLRNDSIIWELSKLKLNNDCVRAGVEDYVYNTKDETYIIKEDIFNADIVKITLTSWRSQGISVREESTMILSIIIVLYVIISFIGNYFILKNHDNRLLMVMCELDSIMESEFTKHHINYLWENNDEIYGIVIRINRILSSILYFYPKILHRKGIEIPPKPPKNPKNTQ